MGKQGHQMTGIGLIKLSLTFAFLALPGAVFAQVGLKLKLVAESTAIVPGQTFRVGLFIQHEKGWHTYWRQPGIVGVPTLIEWTLPAGFIADKLEYPEPEATKMFQIKAQGYERDVLLQTCIQAPSSLQAGEKIMLKGRASWMCCGESCHPDSMELSLEMQVAEKADLDERWHALFKQERAAYAQESPAWKASAEEKGQTVSLTLTPSSPEARPFPDLPATNPVIFFTEDGWINSDEPQQLTWNSDGSLTLKLTRADVFMGKTTPERLYGIVQRQGGWHRDGTLRSLTITPQLIR